MIYRDFSRVPVLAQSTMITHLVGLLSVVAAAGAVSAVYEVYQYRLITNQISRIKQAHRVRDEFGKPTLYYLYTYIFHTNWLISIQPKA